ncbi:MAG TPA: DUF983 domain-containing protein [Alphaproteobacteria bacterium]|nr:DUF983 domain-containing protein [Alphaproteobacteria bacterium]
MSSSPKLDGGSSSLGRLFRQAMRCTCSRCGQGSLYNKGLFDLTLRGVCTSCGLNLAKNDSADGPAVFLIFFLGVLLVPMALMFDAAFSPPLWVHAVLWGVLAIAITVVSLKPLKSLVIAIQFRHRASDWDE